MTREPPEAGSAARGEPPESGLAARREPPENGLAARGEPPENGLAARGEPPEARARYAAFETITTRWMDNDVYNHVNNVVYYSWFDTAVNAWLLREGVLTLQGAEVVCLVVETGCRYFRPVAFPDTIHCGLRVAHLGRSSVRFDVGVFRNDEQEAVAQGFFVHVACDAATHRPVAMPGDMRSALEKLRR